MEFIFLFYYTLELNCFSSLISKYLFLFVRLASNFRQFLEKLFSSNLYKIKIGFKVNSTFLISELFFTNKSLCYIFFPIMSIFVTSIERVSVRNNFLKLNFCKLKVLFCLKFVV